MTAMRRLMLAALVLTVSACTATGTADAPKMSTADRLAPLANPALTPRGWSPVQAGTIQISVPASWFIENPGYACGGGVPGMVFGYEQPKLPAGEGCRYPPNVVAITAAPRGPLHHARHVLRNGIKAELGRRGDTRLLRALGMQVQANGPLADRVLGTLTHSPLSVVLHSATSVPRNWRHVTFGGLRLAVPARWTVRHSAWSSCVFNIEPDVLALRNTRAFTASSCPAVAPIARYLAAQPGMVVDAGPKIEPTPANAHCQRRAALRICIDPPPTGSGDTVGHELSLLTAQITAPGWTHPDQIEIGLTGTGLTPARIFDSIQPAH